MLLRRLSSEVNASACLKFLCLCKPSFKRYKANYLSETSFIKKAISFSSLLLLLTLSSLTFATPADDFVITVKTDNAGSSLSTQFTIPTTGGGYNYSVDCDDATPGTNVSPLNQTSSYTCDYASAGTYTLRIKDNTGVGTGFPRIYFANAGDKLKITSLDQWGTGQWTSMQSAFYGASNMTVPAVDTPDFSVVTSMRSMFYNASIADPDTSNWNTAAVTSMWDMFKGAISAGPDTSLWITAAVTDMEGMFEGAISANPDTSLWNVEAVRFMTDMFLGVTLPTASYDAMLIGFNAQDLQSGRRLHGGNSNYCNAASARTNMISSDGWTITDGGQDCTPAMPVVAPDLQAASDSGALDTDNVTTIILPSFDVVCSEAGNTITLYSDNPTTNTSIGTHSCNAAATETIDATTSLVEGTHNISYTETKLGLESVHSAILALTIADSILDFDFIITVNTNNLSTGSSLATQFTIPTTGTGYNYSVDCDVVNPGTNVSPSNQAGSYTCNYASAGTYTLRIKDNTGVGTGFPRIYFANAGDKLKITSLDQWGTGKWTNMTFAFFGASNMVVPAADTPDFSAVTSMFLMFANASVANPKTSNWNTATVIDMGGMFNGASTANPDTANWDTAMVDNMNSMFQNAISANPDTSLWNIETVLNMANMFSGVTLPTATYDAMLIGFDAQNLKPNIEFHGGNSKYCNGATAKANMISTDSWIISDAGQDCTPAMPASAPDLQAASDSGYSMDDLTDVKLPSFDLFCSQAGNIITLYSDNPATNTSIGTHSCIATATESITATTSLAIGPHNISYTETRLGDVSAPSTTLLLTIVDNILIYDFVMTVNTNNLSTGSSLATQFTIPTTGNGYNYSVDCDASNPGINVSAQGQNGDYTCDYASAGTYTLRITDNTGAGTGFPRIYFNNAGDRLKITSLDQWGTGQWTSMSVAFYGASNMTVSAVDIPDFSAVTSMYGMFAFASAANPDTSNWDTSSVTSMSYMFEGATSANPDTSGWNVEAVNSMTDMFSGVTLPIASYDAMLIGFDAQTLNPSLSFHGGNSKYCNATSARTNMINSDGWSISDGGRDCSSEGAPDLQAASDTGFSDSDDFTDVKLPSFDVLCSQAGNIITLYSDNPATNTSIGTHSCITAAIETITASTSLGITTHNISVTETNLGVESAPSATLLLTIVDNILIYDFVMTVNTNNLSTGSSLATQFNIPTIGSGYNYSVDCDGANPGTNVSPLNQTGSYTCNYALAGTYKLRISDNSGAGTGFPRIYFNNYGDRLKITSLDQWGTGKWTNMTFAFFGASNMVVPAADTPDFSAVTSMFGMFRNVSAANPNTTNWDTSSVTSMSYMFEGATSANPDTSGWNVEAVNFMTNMFSGVTLPLASYDAILIGFDAQTLNPSLSFHGGNSKYCNATSARTNMINSDGWSISDGGRDCSSEGAPDLQAASDTGFSDSDDITDVKLPSFDVLCSQAGNIITLYSDNPATNTSIGTHSCITAAIETITASTSLGIATHNISVTETNLGVESAHSQTLILTVVDNSLNLDFVITVNTNNLSTGSSLATQFTIPTFGGGYNYSVDCDAANPGINVSPLNQTSFYTCDYALAGTYKLRISDNSGAGTGFPRIYFKNSGDKLKITSLDQWGTGQWTSMGEAFYGASNMSVPAVDIPDFSAVRSMYSMFYFASAADPDTSNWDTSSVWYMDNMFNGASAANPNTSNWNTAAVTDMNGMFRGATSANPDTSNWNVEAVFSMNSMFLGVTLPTASYDAMLIGFNAQDLQSGRSLHGGNSNYCNAASARTNMISSDGWTITDGGQDCTVVAASAPDLQAASDTGFSDSDDITDVKLPSFDVVCSQAGNTITLYSDNPVVNTSIGTHSCIAAATETITASTSLGVATHNISYTETNLSVESVHSETLILTIVDNILSLDFVMTVNTNNLSTGSSLATQFTISNVGAGANYSVDCDDTNPGTNVSPLNQSGNYTCNYTLAGTYKLRISDNSGVGTGFSSMNTSSSAEILKITSLDQWGTGKWSNMHSVFSGAQNMTIPAVDTPDFSAVTDMSFMFNGASAANPNTTNWDTSAVTDMNGMFFGASAANPDTSLWNVEAVDSMLLMFKDVKLPTASYDAMLIGFDAQNLKPNVNFHGGNSTYCNAASARTNMINADGWTISDGGQDCTPAMPASAPDLQAASDTGVSNTDNETTVTLPSFDVICSEAVNIITLYSDNPAAKTSIGAHSCLAAATETITATTSLALGMHNISYTETTMGIESVHSNALSIEITLIDDKDKDGLSDTDEATLGTNPLDPDTDGDQIQDGLDDVPLISSNACVGADAIFTDVVTSDTTCAASTSISVESPSEVQSGHLRLIAPLVIFNSGFSAGKLSVKTQDPCANCGP